jgi:hypothetical protein
MRETFLDLAANRFSSSLERKAASIPICRCAEGNIQGSGPRYRDREGPTERITATLSLQAP